MLQPQPPVDEAGPLWLMFEAFMDWLGFWGRLAFVTSFLLLVVFTIALAARRKK